MTTSIQPRIKARRLNVPGLCAKGKKIRHEWAQAVRYASNETWQDVMGKGFLPFARHVAKCEVCKAYQENKRIPL